MKRGFLAGSLAAAAALFLLAAPVLAHGDHDARPIARHIEAGPYRISLWQVYPDAGTSLTPVLIVMFDGDGAMPPASASVQVAVDSAPAEVKPSTTTHHAWETLAGLDKGQTVAVTVSDGTQAWDLAPVVVPPAPTSLLPMEQLIYVSIAMTAGTAWWAARRTARAWRRPVAAPA